MDIDRLYAHKFHQRGYSDVDIAFVVSKKNISLFPKYTQREGLAGNDVFQVTIRMPSAGVAQYAQSGAQKYSQSFLNESRLTKPAVVSFHAWQAQKTHQPSHACVVSCGSQHVFA